MAKLWDKNTSGENDLSKKVEAFTASGDLSADLLLSKYDVIGSIAHAKMLAKVGLLKEEEFLSLQKELTTLYKEIENKNFKISEGSEDIHSEIEFRLTQKLGETGKKIHTARSRNDQVLLDLKLYTREHLEKVVNTVQQLFQTLIALSNQHKEQLLPGYTHLQLAMPSSFGLWFGAYAESLKDDMHLLHAAFSISNNNPLGSGAGYGSSLSIDRKYTTELLGFDDLNYNVVYAQMNRGKMEKIVSFTLSSVAATLSKLAVDCCLYMNQNFAFISFPDALTTGSSIMPHKKNPDVWELIRAKCNLLQNLPAQINSVTNNLPSGYHRDFQVIKEDYLNSFPKLISCLEMADLMLHHIQIKNDILENDQYKLLFTVETVNELVNKGMSFREAYIEVGKQVESGEYRKPVSVAHTHEGSIGNLGNEAISSAMQSILHQFPFEKIQSALRSLLG